MTDNEQLLTARLQSIANEARRIQRKLDDGDCDSDDLLHLVDGIAGMVSDMPELDDDE